MTASVKIQPHDKVSWLCFENKPLNILSEFLPLVLFYHLNFSILYVYRFWYKFLFEGIPSWIFCLFSDHKENFC